MENKSYTVAQRGGRCPIPGNIQGLVGQGTEQPALAKDVPAYGRGLDYVAFKGPFQFKLFYDQGNKLFKKCCRHWPCFC